jgi:hypothetical protein
VASQLEGFSPAEEEMIQRAQEALQSVGYEISLIKVLVRADMPAGYRGMSLDDGAALSGEAFTSQAMLNHVLEEELLHLQQKAGGADFAFGPETARTLEELINEQRRFPCPGD